MTTSNDKTLIRVIGLILLVGGIGVAWWGWQMSESLTSQLSKTLTGALPDVVMHRYIGGAIAGIVGLFLLLKR